ncbi:MAG TPA: hypothetical protein VF532_24745 [Candidatus Angelobacter sp.]
MFHFHSGETRRRSRACVAATAVFALAAATQLPSTAQVPAAQAAQAQTAQVHTPASPISRPASADFDAMKARGTVVASVACAEDATQSYALYLPSQYTPERGWPIIYAFDPFAHGKTAVETYKDAAEKYGYIVVGSNNAKNGPSAPEMTAAQAVWQDTHRRLTIDKDRVYVTGLSGGARFATSFALYCYTCEIAGVIAHGASYPVPMKEIKGANDHFLYYVAVGDADFNLPEILTLRKKKEEQGAQFKIKVYPGPHQWAPPAVVEDALEWLDLKAMQTGTKKADAAFVLHVLEQTREEAAQAEKRGDTLTQFYALRSLAIDFKAIKGFAGVELKAVEEDVSKAEAQLAELKGSKALKKAQHQEQQEIDKQESLTAAAQGQIAQLGQSAPEVQAGFRQQITSAMFDMRRRAKSNASDHALYARAFNGLWIQGIEAGQDQFRKNEFPAAAVYFELMADVAPDQPWPVLLLAETRVRQGTKKAALKALEEAVKRGVKRPETLTQDPELQPLAGDPEFQRIVQGLRGSPTGP